MTAKVKLPEYLLRIAKRIRDTENAGLADTIAAALIASGASDETLSEFARHSVPFHIMGQTMLRESFDALGINAEVYASKDALAQIGEWCLADEDKRGECPVARLMHAMLPDGTIVSTGNEPAKPPTHKSAGHA